MRNLFFYNLDKKRIILWVLGLLLTGFLSVFSNGISYAEYGHVNANRDESRFGPGDVLKIFVYGSPDLTLETKVNEQGKITFPLLGEVAIEGLTPNAAEKRIADRLESGGYLRKPQVTILSSALYSQQVSVLGSVRNQGRYTIDGQRSLTDVLAMAGGISPEGGTIVTLIRTDKNAFVKEEIDTLAIFQTGDMQINQTVRGGDLIYVSIAPRFYIYGEVQRPGFFRLEPDMTVIQALSTGGGLNVRGTERGVRIQRRSADGSLQVIKAKLDDLVEPNDVIYIQESLF